MRGGTRKEPSFLDNQSGVVFRYLRGVNHPPTPHVRNEVIRSILRGWYTSSVSGARGPGGIVR